MVTCIIKTSPLLHSNVISASGKIGKTDFDSKIWLGVCFIVGLLTVWMPQQWYVFSACHLHNCRYWYMSRISEVCATLAAWELSFPAISKIRRVFVHERLVFCSGQEVMKWASYSPHKICPDSGDSKQEIPVCRNSLTWVMMLSPVSIFYCTQLLTVLGHVRKCSVYTIFELVYPVYIRTVVNHVPHSSDHSIMERSHDPSSSF